MPLRFLISLSEVIRAVPMAMAGLAGRPRRLTGIEYHTAGSRSGDPIHPADSFVIFDRSNPKDDWLVRSPGLYVISTWSEVVIRAVPSGREFPACLP